MSNSPSSPIRRSLPTPQTKVSKGVPPTRTSSPAQPSIWSLPPSPLIVSAYAVPTDTSFPFVPFTLTANVLVEDWKRRPLTHLFHQPLFGWHSLSPGHVRQSFRANDRVGLLHLCEHVGFVDAVKSRPRC
ncbi:MAG: hypothetical protein DCF28_03785 [Alphaproteobacteria bacterium]|nr:MAG: hypothetical protein DCF28_03785 [Alphaproteobacteria bacterium]PZO40268.1 MAG: hypothetical protein DCE92_02580 [Alphaproteobacteria bacterium]